MIAAILVLSHFVVAAFAYLLSRKMTLAPLAREVPVLKSTTFELVGSSDQVSSISRDLSAASQEQLDSLSATISSSHEIRSMIDATTDNTTRLSAQAAQLQQMTAKGGEVISKLVSSGQQIKQGAARFESEMNESISQLTTALEVIQGIAQKTQVISEIVFQTKLLAFNASVEAARAGEAGKGFAVVAEEVGSLAQMSGNASNEISSIVKDSVAAVQNAINVTKSRIASLAERTVRSSDEGYRIVQDCEKIFNEMLKEITQTTRGVEEIASAAKEQAIGVTQLDESITALQEVANRNRLVASQTTQFGQEFEFQAQTLSRAVGILSKFAGAALAQAKRLQKFVWSDKLMLGVGPMDDEHKILVGKINALVTELERFGSTREGKALLVSAFKDMAEYTVEHFAHEEEFMESIAYPQFRSHRKIHERLLVQVQEYGAALQSGTLDDQKLISFLRNWLISHIMGVDMQYADHHRQKAGIGARVRAA